MSMLSALTYVGLRSLVHALFIKGADWCVVVDFRSAIDSDLRLSGNIGVSGSIPNNISTYANLMYAFASLQSIVEQLLVQV